MAVIATGCGERASETSSTSPAAETPASESGEDLTARLGPEEQPDPNTEALQFLYWRVDLMFEKRDADGDGMLSLDEFSGELYNFERIDLNTDSFLTKQEIVDDMIPVLRAEGKIP